MKLGLLHPGAMGESIGLAMKQAGHQVYWCESGRSAQSRARARLFTASATLSELVEQVDGIVSVCPPESALAQAVEVSKLDFTGIYLDANAVSPGTAAQVAKTVANYVDGGIVGPPATHAGTTRLFLSGRQATSVAAWFEDSNVQVVLLSQTSSTDSTGLANPYAASALKMAYAAYTKGHSALLLAVNALAERSGVRDALVEEWQRSQAILVPMSSAMAAATAPKAWRFAGEMMEIAATFDDAELSGDFHRGAADLYSRMSALKDQSLSEDALIQVLEQILHEQD